MSKLDSLIDHKIVQNLFIWLCLFIILLGAIQADNKFLVSLYIILLLAPAIYINNLFILPKLKQKRMLFFFLFFINVFLFSGISIYLISQYVGQNVTLKMFVNFTGIMILANTFGSAINIARDSFVRRQKEKDAELKLLKGQLNPHFLFNTLNNLYGLSVLKSDKLPRLMLKLSELLRYSLYETKETLVPLSNELKYLENYISLEKIRLEDKTEIIFEKTGDFSSKKIAPMLLIVFVENAFKHLELSTNKISSVTIKIHLKEQKFVFQCQNTFDTNELKTDHIEAGKSGIGLQNVKKRLDLIYPNMHQLKISKNEEVYLVNLTLNL